MIDAQTSIGTILTQDARRDALHFAVAPVTARGTLQAGDHIGVDAQGFATIGTGNLLGIVDPFLRDVVNAGERFWMFLYPNTITAQRHVWDHPAFAQEHQTYLPAGASPSEKWIREYADGIGLEYTELMLGADDWVRSKARGEWGGYLVQGGLLEGVSTDLAFWDHYEAVRGKTVPAEHKQSFFSCSC